MNKHTLWIMIGHSYAPKPVTYHEQSHYCRFMIGHSLGRMEIWGGHRRGVHVIEAWASGHPEAPAPADYACSEMVSPKSARWGNIFNILSYAAKLFHPNPSVWATFLIFYHNPKAVTYHEPTVMWPIVTVGS